jgi:predicted hydrocarbon binding protein
MMSEELARSWLEALVAGLAGEVDEETRARLMQRCGRACAEHHGSIEVVQALRRDVGELDELLDRLNQLDGFWCGMWQRDGTSVRSVCEVCGCPLVRAGWVELSPTLCHCSRGWAAAVFEIALGGPVQVELRQAIGRGDPVCEFVVRCD